MAQRFGSDIATPDFYDYPWTPPTAVSHDDDFVTIEWAGGIVLRAYCLWLRESAVGVGSDPATREGLMDPAEHALAESIGSAILDGDGAVLVTFGSDGITGRFHPGWLRHVAERKHLPTSWLPAQQTWTASELSEPPTHDGPAVLAGGSAFDEWLNDLVRFGISRLTQLPADPNIALELAAMIGAVRDTNFGPIWDVKADVALAGAADTNSTANTNLRLGPHTDLPTRETPPGYQFLHCLVNETQGGSSTMADGAAVVEYLRNNHPDEYEMLTTAQWVFFNRGPGIDHRWSGPLIDLGVQGAPLTLRAFYPVRAFPNMPESDAPAAYQAMSLFSRLGADERFQLRYPFEAGDLVGFDNRRILHGRDAFSAGGARHLRGIYIDHDEILSTARVVNRRRAATHANKENNHG